VSPELDGFIGNTICAPMMMNLLCNGGAGMYNLPIIFPLHIAKYALLRHVLDSRSNPR
jgi:hypothetical protein